MQDTSAKFSSQSAKFRLIWKGIPLRLSLIHSLKHPLHATDLIRGEMVFLVSRSAEDVDGIEERLELFAMRQEQRRIVWKCFDDSKQLVQSRSMGGCPDKRSPSVTRVANRLKFEESTGVKISDP